MAVLFAATCIWRCRKRRMEMRTLAQTLASPVARVLRPSARASLPGVVAIGALRADGAEPTLAGSGCIVHTDGERCILCSCAHVILYVRSLAERAGGSVLDPTHHGVAVGIGDPVVWRFAAFVEYISSPSRHPLAPPHQPSVHEPSDPQLDLAILVMETSGGNGPDGVQLLAMLAALPLGDSQSVRAGDELMLLGYGQPGVQASLIGSTPGAMQPISATVTRGVCAGIIEDEESGTWIKTDALMLAGHSGGPVVAASGHVVGWSVSSAIDKVKNGGGSYACGLSVVRPLNALLPALGGVLVAHGLLRRDTLSPLAPPEAREAAVRRAVAGTRPSRIHRTGAVIGGSAEKLPTLGVLMARLANACQPWREFSCRLRCVPLRRPVGAVVWR